MTPSPKPGILEITPYVGGRAAVDGVKNPIKLSSNETPLGPSAKTVEALAKASHDLHIYPEGSAEILREAIAEVHGLDPARIVASGEGSDSLLTMLANAYLRPGDEVLFSEHDFIVYKIATLANSATPIEIPDPDLRFDVDAALGRVTDKTRILFIANPNNPTGSYISHQEMRRLHAGLPKHALLVIDAAYGEYVRKNDYEAGIEMVSNYPNVVMTRTFSKIHGLAGLRLGWTYAPASVCDVLNRIRGPFNVSMMQQHTGAAAVRDRAHVDLSVAHNEQWKNYLTEEIRKLGLVVNESVANFILIQFPKGKKSAREADAFLSVKGLILRAVANYGLPDALRLTIGTEDANRRVVAALSEFMGR
ncbi:MAG TPA: histidinol-phosphate transaminase [Rhizomicrobium sp.]|jgi:histidinol-phosphate aminotransferase|nr:histidinol-phosphate transaminase [Rhizomicrobium sp.]